LGNWYQWQLPLQRGFDHHYGLYGALISYYDKVRERYYDWHRNGETIREDGYTTDLFAREFEQLMAARKSERPFFVYVPFNAVHGPDEAPPELVEKYRQLFKEAPGKGARGQGDPAIKCAMLESMDSAIGRMLASLKNTGVADNTLVVFFNDNGGRKSNPPFRGGKGDTFEGGVRVPCVFHWPAHVPAGHTIDGMIHVVDLYPTLLKLAGGSLTQPLPLDGMDMWDTITGGQASPRSEVVHSLPGEHVETGEMAIRQGAWKLVGKELYNIDKDHAETTNLAAQNPEIYQRLHARIQYLVTERRPAQEHLKIPDKPLLVFGERENASPPPWLQAYLDALPESKKTKSRARKK
jgi:arylsulfatase A-like enzyme